MKKNTLILFFILCELLWFSITNAQEKYKYGLSFGFTNSNQLQDLPYPLSDIKAKSVFFPTISVQANYLSFSNFNINSSLSFRKKGGEYEIYYTDASNVDGTDNKKSSLVSTYNISLSTGLKYCYAFDQISLYVIGSPIINYVVSKDVDKIYSDWPINRWIWGYSINVGIEFSFLTNKFFVEGVYDKDLQEVFDRSAFVYNTRTSSGPVKTFNTTFALLAGFLF